MDTFFRERPTLKPLPIQGMNGFRLRPASRQLAYFIFEQLTLASGNGVAQPSSAIARKSRRDRRIVQAAIPAKS